VLRSAHPADRGQHLGTHLLTLPLQIKHRHRVRRRCDEVGAFAKFGLPDSGLAGDVVTEREIVAVQDGIARSYASKANPRVG
jgi:hypothetical protein